MKQQPPDALDRMLAEDGDHAIDGWEDRIAQSMPSQPERVVDHVQAPLRMGRTLNILSAQCAAVENMSRGAWVRMLIAERIEQVMGIPKEESMKDTNFVMRPQRLKERLPPDA